ncbi:sigma-70 family RNA polymerase sigma factor [Amycolatopsis acidicola]|uniref:sigma-70 family RNA polymerase sigma factor n=1 Tax=Amycolatopsis acidicola TaxID=2596893 RepID=UPI001AA0A861|nr:sigma-70 family RNA polymerase sigma factor [Amycolatopsis acidicola]
MADAEQQPADAALIAAIRRGDQRATELLFERHVAFARSAASRWAADAAERDDLVSEGFARVLDAIRRGAGPSENFRPYLLVTMRNLASAWTVRSRRIELHEELPERPDGPQGLDELAVRRWESRTVWSAYSELPERWRTVLWYTEIEGIPPAKVAPLMGITPRAVAALGLRAREGLRQAYLQNQVPATTAPACAAARRHLGAWLRNALPRRKSRLLERHLQDCAHCQELTTSLSGDNGRLRKVTGLPAAAVLGQGTQLVTSGTGVSKVAAFAIATALTVAAPAAVPFTAAAPPPKSTTTEPSAPTTTPAPTPIAESVPIAPKTTGTPAPAPTSAKRPTPVKKGQTKNPPPKGRGNSNGKHLAKGHN